MAKSLLTTFSELDSATKHALADIDSPRMLAFAALNIAETECGVDRLTSEHIVACLECAGVAVKRLSVTRSLAAAGGFVSVQREGAESFYKLMTRGKRGIDTVLGGEKMSVVRIDQGQPRTARLELAAVLQSLSGLVRICDPYYGVRTLDSLDSIPPSTLVRFLTSKTSESGRKLRGAMKDFKRERPRVEFRQASAAAGLHDRFVASANAILILGHGLKDIGGKESFMIRLDKGLVPDLIKETIASFDSKWKKATPL